MKYERLTNGLIRKLNKSCQSLRNAGKCKNDYECFAIGWCGDAWRMAEKRIGERAENNGDNDA